MVNLKEFFEKEREMYDATGKGERLGFCPHCTDGALVSMMWFLEEYDSGSEWLGRACAKCGYESWYHTDVISNLLDPRLEAELKKIRGPKPRLVKLTIWHGAVLLKPSLEQTFEK